MWRRHYKFNYRCSAIVMVILIEFMAASCEESSLKITVIMLSQMGLIIKFTFNVIATANNCSSLLSNCSDCLSKIYYDGRWKRASMISMWALMRSAVGQMVSVCHELVAKFDAKKKGFRNILSCSSSLVPTCPVLETFWRDYGCWCFFFLSLLNSCVFSLDDNLIVSCVWSKHINTPLTKKNMIIPKGIPTFTFTVIKIY